MKLFSFWYGVDLDGCLAEYDHWVDVTHIGNPIPAMVERVKQWLREGKEVRIFTARVWCPRKVRPHAYLILEELEKLRESWLSIDETTRAQPMHDEMTRWIESELSYHYISRWCMEHLGVELKITCVKDPGMIELWDDRCVQVEKNTGKPVREQQQSAGDPLKFA